MSGTQYQLKGKSLAAAKKIHKIRVRMQEELGRMQSFFQQETQKLSVAYQGQMDAELKIIYKELDIDPKNLGQISLNTEMLGSLNMAFLIQVENPKGSDFQKKLAEAAKGKGK